jgi:uncharacterized protein YcnI
MNQLTKLTRTLPVLAALALVAAATASAHARISPAVSVAKELQLYSLAVPTEKEGVTTTKIVLTVPAGFSIDSFVPSPGWTREVRQTGSGEEAVIQKVTWTGGSVPTGEDSLFQFLAEPSASGTVAFQVQQTYSDGQVVSWTDPESGEDPAPAIEVVDSLGGGSSSSTLSLIALVVGAVGVLLGGLALVSRGGRTLT